VSQLLHVAPSNCILIFECLDEAFSYGSCNLCIGVIAIPRASFAGDDPSVPFVCSFIQKGREICRKRRKRHTPMRSCSSGCKTCIARGLNVYARYGKSNRILEADCSTLRTQRKRLWSALNGWPDAWRPSPVSSRHSQPPSLA